MINIAHEVAEILGDAASPERVTSTAYDLYQRLEVIVGRALMEVLTDEQVGEFECFLEAQNDAGAREWLGQQVPNYPDIVVAQWARLRAWFVGELDRLPA